MKDANLKPRLGAIGLFLTLVYLVGIGFFQWSNLLQLRQLELNEFGDFLAGAFGPLAIFWLILGFFQQSGELRLQVKELALSVEQQKELVAVSRETLDHERRTINSREMQRIKALEPKFDIEFRPWMHVGNEYAKYKLSVLNTGGEVTKAKFLVWSEEIEIISLASDVVNLSKRLISDIHGGHQIPRIKHSVQLQISYTDRDGNTWKELYELAPELQSSSADFKVTFTSKEKL